MTKTTETLKQELAQLSLEDRAELAHFLLHSLNPDNNINPPTTPEWIADLHNSEAEDATDELLNIPNFEQALKEAEAEANAGEVVSFKSIRRNV
jgi:hypothetical protein